MFDRASAIGEPASQFVVIVDLPVADSNDAAGLVDHGLTAVVDSAYGKTGGAERGAAGGMMADIIRPPMGQSLKHRLEAQPNRFRLALAVNADNTTNSTHEISRAWHQDTRVKRRDLMYASFLNVRDSCKWSLVIRMYKKKNGMLACCQPML